jgi:hypothetical protein
MMTILTWFVSVHIASLACNQEATSSLKNYRETDPEIIREIKRLRGPFGPRKPVTFKDIADHLNATGVKTRTGTPWTAANVQMTIRK